MENEVRGRAPALRQAYRLAPISGNKALTIHFAWTSLFPFFDKPLTAC